MNPTPPSLVLALVGASRKPAGFLARIAQKLKGRGLEAHVLKNWKDAAVGGGDILLLSCKEEEAGSLAAQVEHLWTRKWNQWYAAAQERRNVSDAE